MKLTNDIKEKLLKISDLWEEKLNLLDHTLIENGNKLYDLGCDGVTLTHLLVYEKMNATSPITKVDDIELQSQFYRPPHFIPICYYEMDENEFENYINQLHKEIDSYEKLYQDAINIMKLLIEYYSYIDEIRQLKVKIKLLEETTDIYEISKRYNLRNY